MIAIDKILHVEPGVAEPLTFSTGERPTDGPDNSYPSQPPKITAAEWLEYFSTVCGTGKG